MSGMTPMLQPSAFSAQHQVGYGQVPMPSVSVQMAAMQFHNAAMVQQQQQHLAMMLHAQQQQMWAAQCSAAAGAVTALTPPLTPQSDRSSPAPRSPQPRARGRRGARRGRSTRWAVDTNDTGAPRRIDPTDGVARTECEFMLRHAVGANFSAAEKMWSEATLVQSDAVPPPLDDNDAGEEEMGLSSSGGNSWSRDDSDRMADISGDEAAPPLLEDTDDEDILAVPSPRASPVAKTVRFACDNTATDSAPLRPAEPLKTHTHELTPVLKSCSRVSRPQSENIDVVHSASA